MRFGRLLSALAVTVALTSATPTPGSAGEPDDKALQLYRQGRADYLAKQYDAAVRALSQSLALVESPKSALLLGHSLREAGQPAAAMMAYERTISIARARPDVSVYQAELDDARKWSATLKEELAELVVAVPKGARVTVAGAAITTTPQSATEDVARAWRTPGPVEVTANHRGREETQRAELPKGRPTAMAFRLEEAPRASPPGTSAPPTRGEPGADRTPLWVPAGVMTGVGLVGMGLFTGFAVSAQAKLDDLTERCGPRCPESERPLADEGERDMLIANVSLGLGAAALATGTILFIVEGTSAPSDATVALAPGVPVAGRLGVDAAGLSVRVRLP